MFPPTCGSATGSIPKSTASLWEDLKVDGIYDLAELGAVAGELNVRAVNEDLTPETAASIHAENP